MVQNYRARMQGGGKASLRSAALLGAVLLGGCSTPAILAEQKTQVRGVVSMNGASTSEGVSALYEKGKAHFVAGQLGLAVNEFQAALVEKPGSVAILNALAATYDRLGRFDLADRYYKQAIALDPKDPKTLNNIAFSLMLRGEPGRAVPLLNLANAETPSDSVIEANLSFAKMLSEKSRQQQAAEPKRDDAEQAAAPAPSQVPLREQPTRIERRSLGVQELVLGKNDVEKKTGGFAAPGPTPVVTLLPSATVATAARDRGTTAERADALPRVMTVSITEVEKGKATPAPLGRIERSPLDVLKIISSAEAAPIEVKPTVVTAPVDARPRSAAEANTSAGRAAHESIEPPQLAAADLAPAASAQTGIERSSAKDAPAPTTVETALNVPPPTDAAHEPSAAQAGAEHRPSAGLCSVEVSNGAGRNGMAARFREFLDSHGLFVRRLTNDRTFANARTTIFYRSGHEEGAREIANLLSAPVGLEVADLDRCDVRVRLGRDLLWFDREITQRLAARSSE